MGLISLAVFAGLLQLFPAVLELRAGRDDRTGEGVIVTVLLLAASAGGAIAFHRLERAGAVSRPLTIPPSTRRAIAGVSVIAVVVVGAVITFGPERTDPLPSSKGRLTQLTNNRGDYWRVALTSWSAHPLTGVGAGSFSVEWRRERDSSEAALDAHSLYMETLAELGLVGGLLLLAFIVTVGAAAVRRSRDPADPLAPAAAGCLVAVLVHVGLDWTWEFPAVILIALILAASVLAAPSPAPEREAS
jgi:O-antigen ligase